MKSQLWKRVKEMQFAIATHAMIIDKICALFYRHFVEICSRAIYKLPVVKIREKKKNSPLSSDAGESLGQRARGRFPRGL